MKNTILPEFNLPTEIFIKQAISKNTFDIVSRYGKRAVFIITGNDFGTYSDTIITIYNSLKSSGMGCVIYDDFSDSPNTEEIDEAVSFVKKTRADVIIGFGGQDSINAAKTVAILATNYMFAHDIFKTTELPSPPLNLITMPAYPSLGFEITPLFYLKDIKDLNYRVYHNKNLYPKATIIDPELSLLAEEETTLTSATSALALATESLVSTFTNDIINTYALKTIDLIFRNLPVAYQEPENIVPRVHLSTASVMSGIAFSISFLSMSLAIALGIASKTEVGVAQAMAIMLPHIMEYNLTTSPGKYVHMSKVMGEDVRDLTVVEAAIKAVEAVRRLSEDIKVTPPLGELGVSQDRFREIAEISRTYPFIENTLRPLSRSEIESILIAAH